MKIINIKILLLVLSTNVLNASTLKDTVNYALKHAPQFQENIFSSRAKIELLKKSLAVYDSLLSVSTAYDNRINSAGTQNDTSKITSVGFSKNIGLGVDFNANYARQSKEISSAKSYQTIASISSDIDLLKNALGRIDKGSITLSKLDQDLLKNSLAQTREGLILGITVSYLNTLKLEMLLKENRALYKNVVVLYNATKLKYKNGSANERNLLQMEAKKLTSEMDIVELKRVVKNSYDQLKTMTGGMVFTALKWPTKQTLTFKNSENNLYLKYLKIQNTQIKQKIKNSEWSKGADLKLSLSYDKGDISSQSYSYGLNNDSKSVGLYLTIPFDDTIANSNYMNSKYLLKENEMIIKREKMELEDEKNQHIREIESYRNQISIATRIIKLQDSRYKKELASFNQGRSDISDVNIAQDDLINSQISLIKKQELLYQSINNQKYLLGFLEDSFKR